MKRLDTFRRDESGGATIEACLWLPFFAIFMIFVIDVTMVFMNESKVHHVVQDGNRQYVVGGFKDEANPTQALETWIEASLDLLTPGAIATASLNPTTGDPDHRSPVSPFRNGPHRRNRPSGRQDDARAGHSSNGVLTMLTPFLAGRSERRPPMKRAVSPSCRC